MRFWVCSLLSIWTHLAVGQHSYNAVVVSATTFKPIEGILVICSNQQQRFSNEMGAVSFVNLVDGNYQIQIRSLDYTPLTTSFQIAGKNASDTLYLHPRNETLKEVVIAAKRDEVDRIKLRGVENTAIYEGKKSELITLKQLVVNTATNNPRQLYARVPGLNIVENDNAGIQLSIGGRGLDPNRTANFNVRQNGYDISADALGYPESYYTPPAEALEQIQVVRGAASLQYGTQFGGLINFVTKRPNPNRKLEIILRQTAGSFGFLNSFVSASGTSNQWGYYTYFQHKQGNGWRPNSAFEQQTAHALLLRTVGRGQLSAEFTHMKYTAQQPGGLSDGMFAKDPRQSNRTRNWFAVNWNLYALQYTLKTSNQGEFNARLFGLIANRSSIGYRPNRVETVDDFKERDLITGDFNNMGLELRRLFRHKLGKKDVVSLIGTRTYLGNNRDQQGLGSTGTDANFTFVNREEFITYDYRFPNFNQSVFAEQAYYLTEKLSVTPGARFEFLQTKADGYYGFISRDLADNIISTSRTSETRNQPRKFVIFGLGLSYKWKKNAEVYANISQNYRSITFADMRINNPSFAIDPNLQDERGYSADLGLRSSQSQWLNYDVSVFALNYNNRIGEIQQVDAFNRVIRYRTNVGRAFIQGIESYAEINAHKWLTQNNRNWLITAFGNAAFITSRYLSSLQTAVVGKRVEFVPQLTAKLGLRLGYQRFKLSYQFSYTDAQFTDATNGITGGPTSVIGIIGAYSVSDLSASYELSRWRFEVSVNNLGDALYFTRRATGYPGPGILPSDGRSFFFTLQFKI